MNYRQLEEIRSTGIKESTPGESAADLEQQQHQKRRQRIHVAPVGKDIIKSVIAGYREYMIGYTQIRLKQGIELYIL